MTLTGYGLLGVIDPADELIPAKRRQAFPQREHCRVRQDGGLKVVPGSVYGAMEKDICHKFSGRARRSASLTP